MNRQGDELRTDMNKLMAHLQEVKLENLSKMTVKVGMRTEDAWNILIVRRQQGEQKAGNWLAHAKQRLVQAQAHVRRVSGPKPRLDWTF